MSGYNLPQSFTFNLTLSDDGWYQEVVDIAIALPDYPSRDYIWLVPVDDMNTPISDAITLYRDTSTDYSYTGQVTTDNIYAILIPDAFSFTLTGEITEPATLNITISTLIKREYLLLIDTTGSYSYLVNQSTDTITQSTASTYYGTVSTNMTYTVADSSAILPDTTPSNNGGDPNPVTNPPTDNGGSGPSAGSDPYITTFRGTKSKLPLYDKEYTLFKGYGMSIKAKNRKIRNESYFSNFDIRYGSKSIQYNLDNHKFKTKGDVSLAKVSNDVAFTTSSGKIASKTKFDSFTFQHDTLGKICIHINPSHRYIFPVFTNQPDLSKVEGILV